MWRNNQVWLKVPVLKTGRSATARGFESLFLRHYNYNIAEWSSLVARRAHNPKVVGSNPSSATKWSRGVVVITSACHAEDRRFEPGRDRHFIFGFVAQLDRVFGYEPKGQGFESLRAHHYREIAQFGSALGLGPRGCRFKSCFPDHLVYKALNFKAFIII